MSASLPADRTFPKVTEGSHGAHLTFGMSTALSGPAANLGIAMLDGVLAAFARQNRAGGIAGHNLELKVLDADHGRRKRQANRVENPSNKSITPWQSTTELNGVAELRAASGP